ncbi:CPBP family intramembrane metalloprotease [Actinoplanes oblitus]|uniref:CPBP family intramembrane metalloprotease n=1 Tax=Actinoplanes oblitus TaxID=3040509 RepID=A0ABY8W8W8_9ACTN|nr:CPBP family intramembrane glutamic endopeptidase [Actinoplanes oblitus]WIM94309.1 CPBP family intramembrane metalloprotease [Actinoplanes oblitus]
MSHSDTLAGNTLIVAVFALLIAGTVRHLRIHKQLLATLATEPGARVRFHRNTILGNVILVGLVAMATGLHPELSAAALGWARPDGHGFDYLVAGAMFLLMGAVWVRSRISPQPSPAVLLLPRTPGERLLAAAMAITVGIGEEVVYRAFPLAVGVRLGHLPIVLAAAAALVLFAAAHAYQGRRGMISSGLLGFLFTDLYVLSGSLLLPIVVHVCWDLVFLLLYKPAPMPQVPAPGAALEQAGPEKAALEEAALQEAGLEEAALQEAVAPAAVPVPAAVPAPGVASGTAAAPVRQIRPPVPS